MVRDPMDLSNCVEHVGAVEGWDRDEVNAENGEWWDYMCGPEDEYRPDPRVYEWRRWEEDLEAVDAFLATEVFAPEADEAGEIGEGGEVVEDVEDALVAEEAWNEVVEEIGCELLVEEVGDELVEEVGDELVEEISDELVKEAEEA